jgi:hypothetical protein
MTADNVNLGGHAVPCVEPAPEIGIVVRFGDRQKPRILNVGIPEVFQFGNFPVEVEVVEVIRKKPRPAHKPPYHWIVKTATRVARIRAMDERNARRIFMENHGSGEEILSIEAEIS